jgi:hypothetical protein
MKALRQAFKPVGRQWGDRTVREMRPQTPVRTGKALASIRVRNNTQRKTVVAGRYYLIFRDRGTKAHDILPKRAKVLAFPIGGHTIYSRKVHQRGLKAHPYFRRSAVAALRSTPAAKIIIDQWNRAA